MSNSFEPGGEVRLEPIAFSDIEGWAEDDHAASFRAFVSGAERMAAHIPKTRALGADGGKLQDLARLASESRRDSGADPRAFFEQNFRPHRLGAPGFVTGYYEPEVAASRVRTGRFAVPLYRRPDDLVALSEDERLPGLEPGVRFARRTETGITHYFDRAAIGAGALKHRGLELAWLESEIDAFFIHVQGSARLRLSDGGTMRIGFDGKSGHPYTSIGRLAVERGLLQRDGAHKDGLEAWLRRHPQEGLALINENRSFIFFRETEQRDEEGPLGAAGVALTAGRSLAVDRTMVTFHTPVWVDAKALSDPDDSARPFRRLMIAHDTGSAIVGAGRGDLFFGSGDMAGSLAGRVRHAAIMHLLIPAEGASAT